MVYPYARDAEKFAFYTALTALGRHEEAIAQWQTILDRYPKYEEYSLIEGKIKRVLGL